MSELDDLDPRWGAGGACGEKVDAAEARAIPMVEERLDSRDLFATGRIVTIAHCGQTYHLRLTAQNKLILTK